MILLDHRENELYKYMLLPIVQKLAKDNLKHSKDKIRNHKTLDDTQITLCVETHKTWLALKRTRTAPKSLT